jgi:3-isopropylmalate/(R)-2-methylmalate dehydratase small subunit
MEPLRTFSSPALVLPLDDVDTDRIVPARFLKVTGRAGLADALFADERRDADGELLPDFPLNRPEASETTILIGGRNFGCGSSREHAVWALRAFGFRAVIAPSFADIFRGNALENGLVPIAVDTPTYARALEQARSSPHAKFTVNVEASLLVLADGETVAFHIEPLARRCLLEGTDTLGVLLAHAADIDGYESAHPAAARAEPLIASLEGGA